MPDNSERLYTHDQLALSRKMSQFEKERKGRLTASLLPFWVGLQGSSRTSYSRETIVRVLNYQQQKVWKPPRPANGKPNEFVEEMLAYGRMHEGDAIAAYMEITRNAVALGSVRRRDSLVAEDDPLLTEEQTPFKWEELLSATPDGLIFDAMETERGNRLKTGRGLIEIKCPASKMPGVEPSNTLRRHDPSIHIKQELDTYGLLQMWEQLEVVREAEYVDFVSWKIDTQHRQYIWLARLYRNNAFQNNIKRLLVDSFSSFQQAIDAIDNVDAVTRQDDVRGMQDMPSGFEYDDLKMNQRQKHDLGVTLKKWAYEHMKFRNCDPEERRNGYPWRSKKELIDSGKPTRFLAKRYALASGDVATDEDLTNATNATSAVSGYTTLNLKVSDLFYREHFDEGSVSEETRVMSSSSATTSPNGQPMHIFDAGNDLSFNYNGKVCMRCGMVCVMSGGIFQNWVDRGNTDKNAVCYNAKYGTAYREVNRLQGGEVQPRGLRGVPVAPVKFEDLD